MEAPALLMDLYELTMVESYLREGMEAPAVFSLFARKLPSRRSYLLACGQWEVLDLIERLRFGDEELAYLRTLGLFSDRLLEWLRSFRFTGDIWAVPEGTPVFPNEPLLEVVAPLPQAQLLETLVINQVHLQTVAASKAARVVQAAAGRRVVDFGARRMHGSDASVKGVRAAYVAGVDGTSNLMAGARYGIPVSGTMAHSYVQAHASELGAFRAFTRAFPDATLLVDTYDSLEGVRNVIRLAREQGEHFRVGAIRLDSGDLVALSRAARALLDEAGLHRVGIFASGGLDEDAVAACVEAGAPISGFGVGTAMGVSADAPSLDMAYKLVAYAGSGRMKLSTGKASWPLQKQLFRREEGGEAREDVLGCHGEALPGRPLLALAMQGGRRLAHEPLAATRERARHELALLPARLRRLEPGPEPYPVTVSAALAAERAALEARLSATPPAAPG